MGNFGNSLLIKKSFARGKKWTVVLLLTKYITFQTLDTFNHIFIKSNVDCLIFLKTLENLERVRGPQKAAFERRVSHLSLCNTQCITSHATKSSLCVASVDAVWTSAGDIMITPALIRGWRGTFWSWPLLSIAWLDLSKQWSGCS